LLEDAEGRQEEGKPEFRDEEALASSDPNPTASEAKP
jgi:hypothetical protein